MSKVYFIGGAPRSGKTTVIQELIRRKPMLAASTDAVRSVAKSLVAPESNQRLHKVARGKFGSPEHLTAMVDNPEAVLQHELGEAEETWKSVLDFISYYQKDGKDVAIEGVAILPDKLRAVSFEYEAVFITTLVDQTDTILDHARTHQEDWVNKYDEATIRAYAAFNLLCNKYYANEAKKHGMTVIDVSPSDFHAGINKAVDALLDE